MECSRAPAQVWQTSDGDLGLHFHWAWTSNHDPTDRGVDEGATYATANSQEIMRVARCERLSNAHGALTRQAHISSINLAGSSSNSFTRTRKLTDSRPSTRRW